MSTNVGTIDLDLILNSKGFKNQLNTAVNNSLKGVSKTAGGTLTSVFSKFGKVVAGAFAVKKVVEFGAECVNLGSDLAEVQNVVDVTFGSMSGKVNEFAKSAITSVGLSETVAKKYMGQYGSMAKAFGYSIDNAYDMSETLTKLTGDVASFYNLSTDEAQTKLKSVFTGETESLKELGVVMTQTALDEFALQKGFGKTTKKMSEQEKVALRLAFVTDRLSDASGDFSRTSDGWANQTRVLSLRFDALKATLGQGLINALTPAVRVLNQLMVYLQKAADAFSAFTARVFGKQEAGASASASATADLAGSMGDVGEAATGTANAVKKAQKSLAGFDKLNVIGSGSESGAGGVATNNASTEDAGDTAAAVEKTATGIDKLKAKLADFWKGFAATFADEGKALKKQAEKTKKTFEKVWGDIQSLGSPLKNWFTSDFASYLKTYAKTAAKIFTGLWDTADTIFGDIWSKAVYPRLKTFITHGLPVVTQFAEEFVKTIGGLFDGVKKIVDAVWTEGVVPVLELGSKVFEDCWKIISDKWKQYGKPVFDKLREAISNVVDLVMKSWNNFIKPCWDMLVQALTELWDNHLKPLVDKIAGFVAELVSCALDIYNKFIAPIVGWLMDVLYPIFRKIFAKIVENVKTQIGMIIDVCGGIITVLQGIVQFITGVFTGDWEKAWEGVKNIFKGVWDSFVAIAKTPINLIIDALNALIRGMNKISIDIPDWVRDITGIEAKTWGFNIAEIPKLANGGYVEANTPQLAMIGDNRHQGEIVAPEGKITEAVMAALGPITEVLQQLGATIKAMQTGKGQDIIVKCILDGKVIYETVVKQNNAHRRQTGTALL